MRSALPESCPESYRQKHYFSVLAFVVEERQRSEAISSCTDMVKVQPNEGCDDKEEVDRRRGLLKLMTLTSC